MQSIIHEDEKRIMEKAVELEHFFIVNHYRNSVIVKSYEKAKGFVNNYNEWKKLGCYLSDKIRDEYILCVKFIMICEEFLKKEMQSVNF